MLKVIRNCLTLALLALVLEPLAHPQAPAAPAMTVTADELSRGEYLAHAADCVACHTVPGGAAYAGGRGMGTPLGVIYTTNITPDPATGIGQYSLQDFDHALRLGIARDGHQLYPSMPYPSYAKLTDADVAALYAYFMRSVAPVRQANRPTGMHWPLNIRWPLALWNVLFLDKGPYQSVSGQDAQWNRGAYLVQGLGHCGACHTPRGWLFEEEALTEAKPAYLSGAPLDNWSAVDLRSDVASGLGRWSESDLVEYLKNGHNASTTAFGSMIDVINYSSQFLTEQDTQAIARYLKSLSPAHPNAPQTWSYNPATETALNASQFTAPGSLDYVQYCAGCHGRDGKGAAPYIPPLAGNPAVLDADAVSVTNITLNGSAPVVFNGTPDAYRMIPFRAAFNDERVAELVTFIRTAWGNNAAPVNAEQVAALRAKTDPVRYQDLDLLRMR